MKTLDQRSTYYKLNMALQMLKAYIREIWFETRYCSELLYWNNFLFVSEVVQK
jgi:hypothetical protein